MHQRPKHLKDYSARRRAGRRPQRHRVVVRKRTTQQRKEHAPSTTDKALTLANKMGQTAGGELGRKAAMEKMGVELAEGELAKRTGIGIAADAGLPLAAEAKALLNVESVAQTGSALLAAETVGEAAAIATGVGAVAAATIAGGAAIGYGMQAAENLFHTPSEHRDELDDEHLQDYAFVTQSYVDPKKRSDVEGFTYDAKMSNATTAVWHDHAHKVTHISHRGTTDLDDLGSDTFIAAGVQGQSTRFQKALADTTAAHEKYGYDVEVSGHSLGGTLTQHTAEVLGKNDWYKKATTFNLGTSPFNSGAVLQYGSGVGKKVTHIRQKKDAISFHQVPFGEEIVLDTAFTPADAHSLSAFKTHGGAFPSGLTVPGAFDAAPETPVANEPPAPPRFASRIIRAPSDDDPTHLPASAAHLQPRAHSEDDEEAFAAAEQLQAEREELREDEDIFIDALVRANVPIDLRSLLQ